MLKKKSYFFEEQDNLTIGEYFKYKHKLQSSELYHGQENNGIVKKLTI